MIDKINSHYSMNNPASIYDEESLTALELAGRTASKVNEVVDAQNQLKSDTEQHLSEQDKTIDQRLTQQDENIEHVRTVTVPEDVTKEVQKQINNGTFDEQIDKSLNNLNERVDNLLGSVTEGSTTLDTEVIDARVDHTGFTWSNSGNSIRYNMKSLSKLFSLLGVTEIPVTDFTLYRESAYVDNNGKEIVNVGFNIYKYDVSEFDYVLITEIGGLVCTGVLKTNDGMIKAIETNKSNFGSALTEIYINVPSTTASSGEGVGVWTIYGINNKNNILTPNRVTTRENIVYTNGYIVNNNFTPNMTGLVCNKIYVEDGFDYIYHSKTDLSLLILGCQYDENDVFIGNIGYSGDKLVLKPECAYFLVNLGLSGGVLPDYVSKEVKPSTDTTIINNNTNKILLHVVNRPFNFTNKTIHYFGDSITQGFTIPSNVTQNNFVKLFSDKVGASYVNKGVGGALFTPEYNEVKTILQQLQETTLNGEYIVVSAGTNDFGLGVPIDEFKTAVGNVCEYLKTNYSGHVIFIAPINRVTPSNNQIAELDEYRQVISDYCSRYEFDFINGGLFHFPNTAGEVATALFGDGLHPSEQGYRLYTKELATILC